MAFHTMITGAVLFWGMEIYKVFIAGMETSFVTGNLDLPQTVGMIMVFGGILFREIAESQRIERSLRLPPVQ